MEEYRAKIKEATALLSLPPTYENPLGLTLGIDTDLSHIEEQFKEIESIRILHNLADVMMYEEV